MKIPGRYTIITPFILTLTLEEAGGLHAPGQFTIG
jgi:hypothetical protein